MTIFNLWGFSYLTWMIRKWRNWRKLSSRGKLSVSEFLGLEIWKGLPLVLWRLLFPLYYWRMSLTLKNILKVVCFSKCQLTTVKYKWNEHIFASDWIYVFCYTKLSTGHLGLLRIKYIFPKTAEWVSNYWMCWYIDWILEFGACVVSCFFTDTLIMIHLHSKFVFTLTCFCNSLTLVDSFFILLQTSAFEGSVFTHSDVKPGMVVKAKVITVDSFGAIVQFSSGVKALCPLRHMSEFEIVKPRKKFQVIKIYIVNNLSLFIFFFFPCLTANSFFFFLKKSFAGWIWNSLSGAWLQVQEDHSYP